MPSETLIVGLSIGAASLLASYVARISSKALRVAAIALIAAPGLSLLVVALVLLHRDDTGELLPMVGLAAYWLLPVAAGVRWGARDQAGLARKRHRWLLPALPVAIALCIVGVGTASDLIARAERRRIDQNESKRKWASAERRLATCARTLTPEEGQRDATTSAASGDRRLLGTYQVFQEGSLFDVPVLEVSDRADGGPGLPPSYVEARPKPGRLIRRFYVKVSPRGEIWTDPWDFVGSSMGRAPDSAAACSEATVSYVRRYNETMLRIGAATAPAGNDPDP
jgi:hypothetical protein